MPVVRYHGKQQSATTTNSEAVPFSNHSWPVYLKLLTTQRECNSSLSQATILVQTRLESLIFACPETPMGKLKKCSVARGFQDIKRNAPVCILVALFIGGKK